MCFKGEEVRPAVKAGRKQPVLGDKQPRANIPSFLPQEPPEASQPIMVTPLPFPDFQLAS